MQKNAYVTAEFQNAISCQKIVRSYGFKEALLHKFDRTLETLTAALYGKDFWASVILSYVQGSMYAFVAVVSAGLAIQTYDGEITLGVFVAILSLLNEITPPVATLGSFMRLAIDNAGSLQRVDEVIFGLESKEGKVKEGQISHTGDEESSTTNVEEGRISYRV